MTAGVSLPVTPQPQGRSVGTVLRDLARAEGSARHPQCMALGGPAGRDVADMAHWLCLVHGRNPGIVDLAAQRGDFPRLADWLKQAAEGFAAERMYITRVAVAAGPLPSTPGAAASGSAMTTQGHALEMLARSDRLGCALGAAVALVFDWHAVRLPLDAAARRFGVEAARSRLPTPADTIAILDGTCFTPATERAMLFGAQQLLVQHRGAWDLLEARMDARSRA